jgi:hypothetical protein
VPYSEYLVTTSLRSGNSPLKRPGTALRAMLPMCQTRRLSADYIPNESTMEHCCAAGLHTHNKS